MRSHSQATMIEDEHGSYSRQISLDKEGRRVEQEISISGEDSFSRLLMESPEGVTSKKMTSSSSGKHYSEVEFKTPNGLTSRKLVKTSGSDYHVLLAVTRPNGEGDIKAISCNGGVVSKFTQEKRLEPKGGYVLRETTYPPSGEPFKLEKIFSDDDKQIF
jgi:hypothetical protein